MLRVYVWMVAAALSSASVARAESRHLPRCEEHRGPGPRIAIVGAGATGLTAAYLLTQRGYRRVTVFEKEDELGGFARTRFVDGKAFDLATMFVPGSTIMGDGVEPLLDEMIEVSGEPLIPAVDFDTLAASRVGNFFSRVPLPLAAACNAPDQVPYCKQQLIEGLALQSKFLSCLSEGVDPVSCGISDPELPNENVVEWGERHDVQLFVQLMLYTSDGLGAAGDLSLGLPNINAMVPMAYWTPAEVYRSLRLLGTTIDEIPDSLPNLQSMFAADSQRWYFFENGYQTFWQSLAENAGIQVELETKVTKVRRRNREPRKWLVSLATPHGNKRRSFDIVIVTAPPGAAAEMLPKRAPQADLLMGAAPGGYPVRVLLAPVGGEPELAAGSLPEPWAFWIKDSRIEASPESVPAVRPFFWQKRYADSDYLVIGSYNYQDVTLDETFVSLADYAQSSLGLNVEPFVASLSAAFPSRPRDVSTWLQGWSKWQGHGGLYFSGEAFFGGGVPGITAGLAKLIAEHFPARTSR